MEEQSKIERLIENVQEYVETRIDLAIINTQEKLADILSSIASIIILSILAIFVLLFASVGVAWCIGQHYQNPSMGYFIVGGFYLLILIIVFFVQDKMIKLPIVNSIIKKITINEED